MSNQCVCYVRVSTEEQATHGVSLAAQEERLKGYCMMSGMSIVATIREEGVSGKISLAERPGGREMQRLVRAKKVEHIRSTGIRLTGTI